MEFLIIDADDTLWENNIYFERAFDQFVDFLAHSSLTPSQVRDVLDEIESVNARVHGYGSLNFGRNLGQCYQHLAEREVREADLETVMGFARKILECPVELIEGVEETLACLAPRHDLTLFTKGHPERAGAENRPLRPVPLFRPPRHRERERRGRLSHPGGNARHAAGADVDDREQPEIGRQPGA